jgi:hypothetical protein
MVMFKRRGAKYSCITYHSPRKRLDEDVALLLGLHVGDGWLSDKWGIMCEKVEGSMINRIIRLAREVLGVEPIIGEYKEGEIMIRSGQRQVLGFF